jgi:sterol 24-C-methyltransferase
MHNSYCANQVNTYYDLVTGFYEYGWGDSFHFAGRSATNTYLAQLLLSIDNSNIRCLSVGMPSCSRSQFRNFTASIPCLHFRYPGETIREGIKRHQHLMALQLGLKKGMKVSGEASLFC